MSIVEQYKFLGSAFDQFLDKQYSGMDVPDDPTQPVEFSSGKVKDVSKYIQIYVKERIVFIDYQWMLMNFPRVKVGMDKENLVLDKSRIKDRSVTEMIEQAFSTSDVGETLKWFVLILNENAYFSALKNSEDWKFELRFYNYHKINRMTEITSDVRNLLTTINGIPIVRGREVAGQPKEVEYECNECGTAKIVLLRKGQKVTKYKKMCMTMIGDSNDTSGKSFYCRSRIYTRKGIRKYQNIFNVQVEALVEETPNKLEPNIFHMELVDNLCQELFLNQIALGTPYRFTGIVKMRDVSSRDGTPRHIPYLEVMHFDEIREKRFEQEIKPEEREEILKFLAETDSLQKATEMFGTRVVGYKREKKFFILSKLNQERFNSTNKKKPKEYMMHTLVVGNYARGKSELAEIMQEICDNPYYVIGSATTGVGLTGITIRDELTGQFGIQAGVLARASGDTLIVEEFDKQKDKAEFGVLNEAMSKFEYTVTKGGKQRKFKSHTNVIVIANPEKKVFDETVSLIPQINITGDLLSRFDVISCILSPKDIQEEIAINLIMLERSEEEVYKIDRENAQFIKKCIKVASEQEPNINTEDVKVYLNNFTKLAFTLAKQTYGADQDFYSNITPRHRHSLLKVIKAVAMWHLHPVPTKDDMEEAFQLMGSFWKEFVDRPKLLNMKEIEMGMTIEEIEDTVEQKLADSKWEIKIDTSRETKKGRRETVMDIIRDDQVKNGMTELVWLQKWAEENLQMSSTEFDDLIKHMMTEGEVFSPRNGFIKVL